ncbi:MAG: GNAT family N-acetyltransferase [Patescibacteria group bacterium]|jgi:ribosomal protein S18 acetylase RimI-like enzyme|nr:GNAT family N-acetyltransferase [Patescibacteria group bacterium]
MTENYLVRPVETDDIKRIWEIRNHEDVRKVSGSSDIITLENHLSWFNKKYFTTRQNLCYVLANNNQIIGYCRFDYDPDKNYYVVSIAVDPEFHSRGLGGILLAQSLKEFGGRGAVLAQIKKLNIPSIKLFEKNGFVLDHQDQENWYLIYNN